METDDIQFSTDNFDMIKIGVHSSVRKL